MSEPPSIRAHPLDTARPDPPAPARFTWARRRPKGPALLAAIFVLPYLTLMLAWALSNPPGAAPDEPDHLVKAIGVAKFDIGTPYHASPGTRTPITIRNDSVSREVRIPARLSPAGYTCYAFQPEQSAACLPTAAPPQSGTTLWKTAMGSYPPFLYAPIGFAADLTGTPYHAFVAGRLVVVFMSALLLWLGCVHLVRWLGRTALIGAAIAVTPMTVFISASVGLSGVEITGALAVAAIAVTAIRRPESLQQGGTQLLLAGVGAALILSRQLGIVTFAAVIALLVVRLGWRFFWNLIVGLRPAFIASVGILVASAVAIVTWEKRYDHPAHTGPLFSARALGSFSQQGYGILQSAIGRFGWLDTTMPRWSYAAYLILLILLVGLAVLSGSRADTWTLAAWLVGTVLVAYVTYSSVFFPILAGLQGRHVLPLFMMVPMLSGAVLAQRLGSAGRQMLRRFINVVAVVVPVLQFVGLYMNARRYAVGDNGPIFFLRHSAWRPFAGWLPWLALGAIATIGLVFVIGATRPDRLPATEEVLLHVEG